MPRKTLLEIPLVSHLKPQKIACQISLRTVWQESFSLFPVHLFSISICHNLCFKLCCSPNSCSSATRIYLDISDELLLSLDSWVQRQRYDWTYLAFVYILRWCWRIFPYAQSYVSDMCGLLRNFNRPGLTPVLLAIPHGVSICFLACFYKPTHLFHISGGVATSKFLIRKQAASL